jgi:hypothetical protein
MASSAEDLLSCGDLELCGYPKLFEPGVTSIRRLRRVRRMTWEAAVL